MKIKHVEELVGITRKNIRFYEEQGLLSPGRAENGYREYRDEDIRRLKQIKFLRKLFVPIEEIRAVLNGQRSLEECLTRQLREIDRQKSNLDKMKGVCTDLLHDPPGAALSPEQLDIDLCLEKITRLEKEGTEFMNVNATDVHRRKSLGSLLGASVMVLLMCLVAAMLWWGNTVAPLPWGIFAVLISIPCIIILCVIIVLVQRIREIKGGEEDEAAQY